MRGYMFTPIVFIALFLIAASFSFYVSRSDRSIAAGVNHEAEIKKAFLDAERDMLRASEVGFEALYTGPTVNNRTAMESAVALAIKNRLGINASIVIAGVGRKSTSLNITFNDYVRKRNFTDHAPGDYDILVNLSGHSFKTVVGVPSYNFSRFYETYNSSEVCGYYNENATDCWLGQKYGSDKESATGFYFHARIISQCQNKAFTFRVNITDPENIATYGYKLSLDNRTAQGTYNFTVGC